MPRDRRREQQLLVNRRQRLLLTEPAAPASPITNTQEAIEAQNPLLFYTFTATSGGIPNEGSLGSTYDLTTVLGSPTYSAATKDNDPPAGKTAVHFDGNTLDQAFYSTAATNYGALGTAMGTAGYITLGFSVLSSVHAQQVFGIVKAGALGNRFQIAVTTGAGPIRIQAYNNANVAMLNANSNHQGLGDAIPHMVTLVQPGDGTGPYFIVDGKVDTATLHTAGNENFWWPDVASNWTNMVVGGQQTTFPLVTLNDEVQGEIDYISVHTGAVDEAAIIAMHDRYVRNVDMVVGNSGASEGYATSWPNSSISRQPIDGQTLTALYVNGSNLFVADFGGNISGGNSLYVRIEGANNNNRYTLAWNQANNRYELANQVTLAGLLLANIGNTLKMRITIA